MGLSTKQASRHAGSVHIRPNMTPHACMWLEGERKRASACEKERERDNAVLPLVDKHGTYVAARKLDARVLLLQQGPELFSPSHLSPPPAFIQLPD